MAIVPSFLLAPGSWWSCLSLCIPLRFCVTLGMLFVSRSVLISPLLSFPRCDFCVYGEVITILCLCVVNVFLFCGCLFVNSLNEVFRFLMGLVVVVFVCAPFWKMAVFPELLTVCRYKHMPVQTLWHQVLIILSVCLVFFCMTPFGQRTRKEKQ